MRPYIFGERQGIHILDLAQTAVLAERALEQVRQVAASGQRVLFVGTKKQARETVRQQAERCGQPYVINRWLGGTLTNWVTISRRIEHLVELEQRMAMEDEANLSKRERLGRQKEYQRMHRSLGGLRTLERPPGLLFVIDPSMEEIAITEGNRTGIPIVAMCDTDANPDLVDYPIPANDDAIRAIQLITSLIAEAVLEGMARGEVQAPAPAAPAAPVAAAAPAAAPAAPAADAAADTATGTATGTATDAPAG